MALDEDAVRSAIRTLNDIGFTRFASSADSRVGKYEHRLNETFNFHRHEIAILCVLLLRGPQRRRAANANRANVRFRRPRVSSQRAKPAGEAGAATGESVCRGSLEQKGRGMCNCCLTLQKRIRRRAKSVSESLAPRTDRLGAMEAEIRRLRDDVSALQEQFAQFRKQFE